MEIIDYLRRVKAVPVWDRIPAISDIELDEMLHSLDTDTQNFSFSCMQYEYTEDMDKHEITLGNRIGGFILFDVPFYCKGGIATPMRDIKGSVKSHPTKTIVAVALHKGNDIFTAPQYFFVNPNISKICVKHNSFVIPIQ